MVKKSSKYRNKASLDIGAFSIKMTEISGPPEKPSLVTFGSRKIKGVGTDSLPSQIKGLAEEIKLSVKDINISLSGSSVVSRVISMPDMADDELRSAIRFEVEKFIPFDINDCLLDHYVQSKGPKDKGNKDVLLAAAKRDSVIARVKAVEEAGFTVNIVDVDCFAMTNAFVRNFQQPEQSKTIALLNIGFSHTNLLIIRDGLVSFVRDLSIGSASFSDAVLKKCGVDIEAADWSKNIAPEKSADVAACSKLVLSALLDEIKMSFGYYENQSGRSIDLIYVAGGGAEFAGMLDAFNETVGIKPEKWNPFQFMDIDPSVVNIDAIAKNSGSYAVAVGLAIRQP